MAAVIDLLVRRSVKSAVKSLAPWIILAIPIVVILHMTQPAAIVPDQPLWFRPIVFFDAIGFYLLKIALPFQFAVDYSRSPTWLREHPGELWMAALSIAAFVFAWTARRHYPRLLAGLALLVAGLLPFLGLIKFDFQHFSTVADRYAYPGMLGIALIGAALAKWKSSTRVNAAFCLVLAFFAIQSNAQSRVWSGTRTLFNHNVAVNPASLQAHSNLGFLDMKAHRVDEAIGHYRQALLTDPSDPDANTDLANALLAKGDFARAVEHYQCAMQTMPNDPRIHLNLGSALASLHQYPQAAKEFEMALAECESDLDPGKDVRVQAHTNLGIILEQVGRVEDAKTQYQQALAIDPNFMLARQGLKRLESIQNK
jgi:tetratricopeptide (TPR) repeat protein